MNWESLKAPIEAAWETRQSLSPAQAPEPVRAAVEAVLDGLEAGQLRVAEPDQDGGWRVNQWLKKAVLLSFRLRENQVMEGDGLRFYDKVPVRWGFGDSDGAAAIAALPAPVLCNA